MWRVIEGGYIRTGEKRAVMTRRRMRSNLRAIANNDVDKGLIMLYA